jgi:hypothetical protein
MKITDKDRAIAEKYNNAKTNQFGNLHERMKYVMAQLTEQSASTIGNDLWQALFDLQTEVSFYEPQSPPYGRRIHAER